MSEQKYESVGQQDVVAPLIRDYEGIGELVTGSSDPTKVLFTALCMLNNPQVNQYLLDNNLKLADRITKTVIFPREGMALLDGQVYSAPVESEENK